MNEAHHPQNRRAPPTRPSIDLCSKSFARLGDRRVHFFLRHVSELHAESRQNVALPRVVLGVHVCMHLRRVKCSTRTVRSFCQCASESPMRLNTNSASGSSHSDWNGSPSAVVP